MNLYLLSAWVMLLESKLPGRIRELQQAGVCFYQVPLTLLVSKGVRGDAKRNHQQIRTLEQSLLREVIEIQGSQEYVQINLRGLAARLQASSANPVRASILMDLLQGWVSERWIHVKRVGRDLVRVEGTDEVVACLPTHQELAGCAIEILYKKLGNQTGARLRVEYEIGQLLKDVNQHTPSLSWSQEQLESVLLWLHQRKIIRLTEGLNLFHQAFKLRVTKGARITTVSSRYPEVKAHYDQQTYRTHVMLQYGKTEDTALRQKLVADYFGLPQNQFRENYPDLSAETSQRPVTQADYNQIMGPLNPAQREIVLAEDSSLVVIAGPGSGKTRTIVHKIAHLRSCSKERKMRGKGVKPFESQEQWNLSLPTPKG